MDGTGATSYAHQLSLQVRRDLLLPLTLLWLVVLLFVQLIAFEGPDQAAPWLFGVDRFSSGRAILLEPSFRDRSAMRVLVKRSPQMMFSQPFLVDLRLRKVQCGLTLIIRCSI
ncbi:hypothetical protein E2C01_062476 [Portunus trituberculatus]|uniref:Uncharacterized protein n=1 Tax=Portunus trituberculatus TaxID=210409 RepID=A0A5B7HHE4_PORTR|nr:hypothetical protein [Portunus trituberculatus]